MVHPGIRSSWLASVVMLICLPAICVTPQLHTFAQSPALAQFGARGNPVHECLCDQPRLRAESD